MPQWKEKVFGSLLRAVVLLLATVFAGMASAQQTVTLDSIGFANLPGDSIEIKLTFDTAPPTPSSFVLDNPSRISIDLLGVASGLTQQRFNIDSNNAQSVMVLDDGSRTRLVVNLDELVAYDMSLAGNVLTVQVGNDTSTGTGVAAAGQVISAAPSGVNEITDVTFRRGDNEEGQVIIDLSNDRVIGSIEQVGARVYVEFNNTGVPDDLNRRFDVSDFATNVSTVDVLGQSDRATVVIDIDGTYEYVAYQSGNRYTVSVRPPALDVSQQDAISLYTGEIVGLTFQDIPIRSVLQIMADYYDFSLVAGDSVQGNVTLVLDNVPWDQALELVLRAGNLGSRLEGNVLYVAPADEIAAQDAQELAAVQQAQALAPIFTEFIQINYADANQIMALITGEGSGGGAAPAAIPIPGAEGAALAPV
ncbi:MAG: AMIN domain-containing protein, partial [Gammaproteobacteria bacterium]